MFPTMSFVSFLFKKNPNKQGHAITFQVGSGTHVAQTGLELEILLPQPPECWDYRYVPPGSFTLFF
jgi:hypothetical protein